MSDTLPPNLTVEALALSPAELRAYPRWYTDLLLRKRCETVAIGDTMNFVDNFGISDADKDRIVRLFGGQLVTLEPPQFYVFLRLTGHVIEGKALRRELAFVAAPVPRPRSILSKKKRADRAADRGDRGGDEDERVLGSGGIQKAPNPFRKAARPADMDSFLTLMAGNGKAHKRNGGNGGSGGGLGSSGGGRARKRVTFDSRPPQVAEAAQRSIQELLRQQGRQLPQVYTPIPAQQPTLAQQAQNAQNARQSEEDEPEPDNHFANVNIDSVLHHGTSTLPQPPPPRKLTPLAPNFTGPAEMQQLGFLPQGASLSAVAEQPFVFNAVPEQPASGPQLSQLGQRQSSDNAHLALPQPFHFPGGGSPNDSPRRLSPQVSGLSMQHSGMPGLQVQHSGQPFAQAAAPFAPAFAPFAPAAPAAPAGMLGVPSGPFARETSPFTPQGSPQPQLQPGAAGRPMPPAPPPARAAVRPGFSGADFLNSVAAPGTVSGPGVGPGGFGPRPGDFRVAPPPAFARADPYDTQALRDGVNDLPRW